MRGGDRSLVIGWLGVVAIVWAIAMALAMAGNRGDLGGHHPLSPWPAALAEANGR